MRIQVMPPITAILDVRVPTTTPSMPEESRREILDNVQPGDVILETNNAYPNWQRLEQVAFGSSFTHTAIFEGWQNGKPMMLEATTGDPGGVIRTNLEEYLQGPVKLALVRPDYQSKEDIESALNFCRKQLGTPYDSGFNYKDDSTFYCSELIQKALKSMPHPIEARTTRALGIGRESIAPDAFLALPNARHFGDEPHFWANMASHWPVAAAAVGAAVGGAALAAGLQASPWGGGAAGFVTGLVGSICVGNKIQTGHFNMFGVDHK